MSKNPRVPSVPLKSFVAAQRVVVVQNEAGIQLNAVGTVGRIRQDGGAWVALDQRSPVSAVHPFPAGDTRETHVLAYPEDCRPAQNNHEERREARKANARAEEPVPTIANFGKDHWSTFAYIETRIVDYQGLPDKQHMRCIDARHPFQAHGHDSSTHPTRLKEGTVSNHDDWDCCQDLIEAGLLEDLGTAIQPQFRLTERGHEVSAQLRKHKAEGGNFSNFTTK